MQGHAAEDFPLQIIFGSLTKLFPLGKKRSLDGVFAVRRALAHIGRSSCMPELRRSNESWSEPMNNPVTLLAMIAVGSWIGVEAYVLGAGAIAVLNLW